MTRRNNWRKKLNIKRTQTGLFSVKFREGEKEEKDLRIWRYYGSEYQSKETEKYIEENNKKYDYDHLGELFRKLPFRIVLEIINEYLEIKLEPIDRYVKYRYASYYDFTKRTTSGKSAEGRINYLKSFSFFYGYFDRDKHRKVFPIFMSFEVQTYPGDFNLRIFKYLPLKHIHYLQWMNGSMPTIKKKEEVKFIEVLNRNCQKLYSYYGMQGRVLSSIKVFNIKTLRKMNFSFTIPNDKIHPNEVVDAFNKNFSMLEKISFSIDFVKEKRCNRVRKHLTKYLHLPNLKNLRISPLYIPRNQPFYTIKNTTINKFRVQQMNDMELLDDEMLNFFLERKDIVELDLYNSGNGSRLQYLKGKKLVIRKIVKKDFQKVKLLIPLFASVPFVILRDKNEISKEEFSKYFGVLKNVVKLTVDKEYKRYSNKDSENAIYIEGRERVIEYFKENIVRTDNGLVQGDKIETSSALEEVNRD